MLTLIKSRYLFSMTHFNEKKKFVHCLTLIKKDVFSLNFLSSQISILNLAGVHLCYHTHVSLQWRVEKKRLCIFFSPAFFPFTRIVISSTCACHVHSTDVSHHWLCHLSVAPVDSCGFYTQVARFRYFGHQFKQEFGMQNEFHGHFFFLVLCRICLLRPQNNTSLSRLQYLGFY